VSPIDPNSVYHAFQATAVRHPDNDFLHIPAQATRRYADGSIGLSYGEAAATIDTLTRRYRSAGYGAGHRVALMLQNRPAFFLHWLALNGLGVSVVPINDEMSAEEQAYILNHSEACLLIHLADLAEKMAPLQPLLEHAPVCIAAETIEALPAAVTRAATTTSNLDSECALLYTSGSTGKPKGCILGNEYFLLSGQRYVELGDLCTIEPGRDRLITPLPLVHMNAMACSTLAMILTGGCIVQLDRFHPRTWWQSVRESGATIAHYLGVMPAMLLNMPAGDDDFSGQLRFAFGAGVNPRHHAAFESRFGFPLIEAWGMTETGNYGAIIASREPRHVGSACFGKPPGHLEIRLVDERGVPVSAGEPGELLLRHRGDAPRRGFFSGYLKNQQATDEAWAGGWFHTGDVVRQDADGSMHFVDRRKNVIRRSGENISALEVEAVLSEDPDIGLVVVCPVPDEVRGDEVMACVIPTAGAATDQSAAEGIASRALQSLVYFKIPGYISFHQQLPLTPSEKPKRAEIRALAAAALQQGRCHDVRHLKKRQVGNA
jgi:acyl-CoA synthetase (AMP-forming)/AMP-acid ligase II